LAEKFSEGEGQRKKIKKQQKTPKNSNIKPLLGGGGQRKKDRKIAKKA